LLQALHLETTPNGNPPGGGVSGGVYNQSVWMYVCGCFFLVYTVALRLPPRLAIPSRTPICFCSTAVDVCPGSRVFVCVDMCACVCVCVCFFKCTQQRCAYCPSCNTLTQSHTSSCNTLTQSVLQHPHTIPHNTLTQSHTHSSSAAADVCPGSCVRVYVRACVCVRVRVCVCVFSSVHRSDALTQRLVIL